MYRGIHGVFLVLFSETKSEYTTRKTAYWIKWLIYENNNIVKTKRVVLISCAQFREFEWFAVLFGGLHGRRSITTGKSFTARCSWHIFCYKELCIWTFIKNHWLAIVRVLQFWTGNQSLQQMMKEASHQRSEGVGGGIRKLRQCRGIWVS